MRYPHPGIRSRAGTPALLAALACSPALADVPPGSPGGESAVWAAKQVRFVYLGFTAHYSCDGLADKVRDVLVSLGARDVQISEAPCGTPYGKPDPFPGVTIKMNVLAPVSGATGSAAAQPLHAHWQMVDLTRAPNVLQTAGACELYEQIRESILPQFTTRNIDFASSCIPHQLQVGGIRLRAEVLMPDVPPASGPAAAAR